MSYQDSQARVEHTGAPKGRRRALTVALIAGVAGLVAITGIAVYWAMSSRDDVVVAASSSTTAPTAASSEVPSGTPEATPELMDGFAPVPQFVAARIPWGEVGPGWFLVDYRNVDPSFPSAIDVDSGVQPSQPRSGGLSLVSPQGQWYSVAARAELPVGPVVAWDGAAAWFATGSSARVDDYLVHLTLVDLQSGQVSDGGDSGFTRAFRSGFVPAAEGLAIAFSYGGDGYSIEPVGPQAATATACNGVLGGYWAWAFDDMGFYVSPDGMHMLCFAGAEAGTGAHVSAIPLGAGSQLIEVGTFKSDPMSYVFLGWVDESKFLVAPSTYNAIGDRVITTAYQMNIDGSGQTEEPVDFYAEATGFFVTDAQRHVVFGGAAGSSSLGVWTREGAEIARLNLACGAGVAQVAVSGDLLMASCYEQSWVTLLDLSSGDTLGQWTMGAGFEAVAFGTN